MFECKKAKYKVGQYVRVIKGNKEDIGKVGRITEVWQLARRNGNVANDTVKGYTRATYGVTGVNYNMLFSYQLELLVPQPKEIEIWTEDFPVQLKGNDHVKSHSTNRLTSINSSHNSDKRNQSLSQVVKKISKINVN